MSKGCASPRAAARFGGSRRRTGREAPVSRLLIIGCRASGGITTANPCRGASQEHAPSAAAPDKRLPWPDRFGIIFGRSSLAARLRCRSGGKAGIRARQIAQVGISIAPSRADCGPDPFTLGRNSGRCVGQALCHRAIRSGLAAAQWVCNIIKRPGHHPYRHCVSTVDGRFNAIEGSPRRCRRSW